MNEDSQNILSIKLGVDSFKYSVVAPFQTEIPSEDIWKLDVSLSLTANLKKFFQDKDGWQYFQQVNVLLEKSLYVTVPMEFFDASKSDVLYYHNLPQRENETVLYNVIESCGLVVIFSIDTSAYRLLTSLYTNIRFFTHVSPLIEYFAAKSHQGNNRKMYVNLRKNVIDVICLDHGRLLLANSYACREISDRLYFLMYVWQQIGFDQENDEILLLGNIQDKNLLLQEVDKYIRHRIVLNSTVYVELKSFWQ